jgi:hypothetical protein
MVWQFLNRAETAYPHNWGGTGWIEALSASHRVIALDLRLRFDSIEDERLRSVARVVGLWNCLTKNCLG